MIYIPLVLPCTSLHYSAIWTGVQLQNYAMLVRISGSCRSRNKLPTFDISLGYHNTGISAVSHPKETTSLNKTKTAPWPCALSMLTDLHRSPFNCASSQIYSCLRVYCF